MRFYGFDELKSGWDPRQSNDMIKGSLAFACNLTFSNGGYLLMVEIYCIAGLWTVDLKNFQVFHFC